MNRTTLILALSAAFGSSFAAAQSVNADGAIVGASDEVVIYPTGEMPRDSDLPATIDKVNYLDEANIAHRKSIGALYDANAKQDTAINSVAQATKANQANINTVASNMGAVTQRVTTMGNEVKAAAASASTANINAASAAASANTAKTIGNNALNETKKLWADKASVDNVNEVRGALSDESSERISNDDAESAERIKNDTIEASERIDGDARNAAGIDALESKKADRVELNELNRATNQTSHDYADRAEKNANSYTDQKFNAASNRMDTIERHQKQNKRETRGGVAGVAAMANIPTAREIGRMNIGAGTGFYKDTSAIAVGGSYRFNSNVTFKGSVSTTGRDTVAGAGVSYEL